MFQKMSYGMPINWYLLRIAIGVFAIFFLIARVACPDAMIVTQAMKASTIVEVFIDEGKIVCEFEIGEEDIPAFCNRPPGKIFESLSVESTTRAGWIQTFLDDGWSMKADENLLVGKLINVSQGKRVSRDEITGEPLAEQPSDTENVLRICMHYTLSITPKSVSLCPPSIADTENPIANIGFVVYHQGVSVNDFRYLSREETLDLDWIDPWYSRFRHSNLRRQFSAPLSVYLYVEPYEVRKEIVMRPKDLANWIDLEALEDDVISVDSQPRIKEKAVELLSAKNPVTIDGKVALGKLDRIHFVRRTLRTTGIVDPPVEIDTASATMGIIFVYPIDQLPSQVTVEWELFHPKIETIPAVATDEAGGLPSQITRDDPVLVWNNYLTNPTIPRLAIISQPPSQRQNYFLIALVACGLFVLGRSVRLGLSQLRKERIDQIAAGRTVSTLLVGVCLIAIGVTLFTRIGASMPEEEARPLLNGLLHNVYRSFDHHEDSLIYDRLSQSISGELLSKVFLETRKSMEIKNQGGLRISVKELEVLDLKPIRHNRKNELTYQCRWVVSGSVAHWGHIHQRANEHLALITIAPKDDRWKIISMDILDGQSVNLQPGTTTI